MKVISKILYSIYFVALLTCFIVNLAVSGTLSWFFIVLTALLTMFTLTSLYIYIKKYKVLIISLSFLCSLVLLLGVTSINTGGNWFVIATAPIIFSYLVIFTPILIGLYQVPQFIKNHNAIFSFIIDLIGLIMLLAIINHYNNGDWLLSIAIPIVLVSSLIPLIFILITKYLKMNWGYKISLYFVLGAIVTPTINLLIASILDEKFTFKINFDNWSHSDYINGNINVILSFSCLLLAMVFGTIGAFISNTRKS